jgi:carbon-monoxide dehydrogenase iron sulfur subunit
VDRILFIDVEKCLGCHSCTINCAVAHSRSKDLVGAMREGSAQPRVFVEALGGKSLPIQCRHCEDAPCITVCPSRAISRASDNSPVVLDNGRCIGCHACIMACPFGVIRKGRDGKTLIKCDLCVERLEEGKEPACVAGCPTGAIRFLSVEEVSAAKRKRYRVFIQEGGNPV